MEGTVYRSTGSWYDIKTIEGLYYNCRLKGKLKLKGLKVTNPVAVGDLVRFEPEENTLDQGIISDILPRKNYLVRKSVHKTEHAHLIACNIDYVLVIFTLDQPKTSLGFLDRVLVSAEAFRIPTLILFNKIDLLDKESLDYVTELADLYTELGYETALGSALDPNSISFLLEKLKNKTILITGHSGVGKSTFLNSLSPDLDLATSEISSFANKGVHTTTFAEMFDLGHGIKLIDTPGIKELGIMEIAQDELSHYFPELRERLGQCKFHNCKHISEPSCAIKKAIEEGEISYTRYNSYLSMYGGEDNRK